MCVCVREREREREREITIVVARPYAGPPGCGLDEKKYIGIEGDLSAALFNPIYLQIVKPRTDGMTTQTSHKHRVLTYNK